MAPQAIWAVIPVKPLREGKSRLALPIGERVALNRTFLLHMLAIVGAVVSADRIVVVSRDPDVLVMARRAGTRGLREAANGDLNDAVAHAARFAEQRGATAILSIATDLPWATSADIAALLAAYRRENGVVIAPDVAGSGTNALVMPPMSITYGYGRDSFWHHVSAARRAGLPVSVISLDGLANDVDLPAQHASLALAGQRSDRPDGLSSSHPHRKDVAS